MLYLLKKEIKKMKMNFIPITIDNVKEIMKWSYDSGPMKSVDMGPYLENYEKSNGKSLKGPGNCDGFGVFDKNGHLIGLFEYYFLDTIMEIGLALNPDTKGKGLGTEFTEKGIAFGIKHFDYKGTYVQLHVDTTNTAAIKVYEKAGFKTVATKGEQGRETREYEMKKFFQ